MKIALASPPIPKSLTDGLYWVKLLTEKAAAGNANIVCFPESYLPGYRGYEYNGEAHNPAKLESAL